MRRGRVITEWSREMFTYFPFITQKRERGVRGVNLAFQSTVQRASKRLPFTHTLNTKYRISFHTDSVDSIRFFMWDFSYSLSAPVEIYDFLVVAVWLLSRHVFRSLSFLSYIFVFIHISLLLFRQKNNESIFQLNSFKFNKMGGGETKWKLCGLSLPFLRWYC